MNKLELVDANKYRKEIKKLYKEAFPRNERLPIFILNLLSKKEKANFYGICDEKTFVGLLYNIYFKDIVFIFYFAIDSNLRGKGYGTKVLELVKQKYKNHRIILNIEEINSKYDNNNQRIKRKKFYEKNGFINSDFKVKEGKQIYEVLYYSENNEIVKKDEYDSLLKHFLGNTLYKVYKKISE